MTTVKYPPPALPMGERTGRSRLAERNMLIVMKLHLDGSEGDDDGGREWMTGAVSIALEEPREWYPHAPDNPEEQSRLLNAIRSKVAGKIDTYCKEVLLRDRRTGHWLPAYQNISGYGTKVRRARTVARILEDRAELPNEGVGKFTKDIWHIVQETITQVCQQPAAAPTQEATAS